MHAGERLRLKMTFSNYLFIHFWSVTRSTDQTSSMMSVGSRLQVLTDITEVLKRVGCPSSFEPQKMEEGTL